MKRILCLLLALLATSASATSVNTPVGKNLTGGNLLMGSAATSPATYSFGLMLGDTSAGASLAAGKTYGYQWQVDNGDVNGFELRLMQLNQGGSKTQLLDFSRGTSQVNIGDSTVNGGQLQLCVLGTRTSCQGAAESVMIDTGTFGGNYYGIYIMNTRASTQATSDFFIRFGDQTATRGSIVPASTTTIAYNTSSDRRLKTSIKPMTDGLATVRRMDPVDFRWKQDGHADKGFVAQDLKRVYPFVVTGDESGDPRTDPMQVDYGRITPVLAAAIKDLDRENQSLKAQLAALQKRLDEAGL